MTEASARTWPVEAPASLRNLDPASYQPHFLHGADRNWLETNCYVDLWIEVLHALGLEPAAALGFTLTQDFEGDQFTFFKFPPEDLASLYGIGVQELAIFDTVEAHALEQLRRGRLVLVEVDSFYLPDTRGVSYGNTHGKTTIAINRLDSQGRRLEYFHNAGYFSLEGEDFDGLFRKPPVLFPYVEFVKLGKSPPASMLKDAALKLLQMHLLHCPNGNPVRSYQLAFPVQLEELMLRPMEYFHLYAFNTLRQLGANFELLGSHLVWLGGQGEAGLETAATACEQIAVGAKSMQFQLARAVARKRIDKLEGAFDTLATAYDGLIGELRRRYLA